jgi:hypothetical protein
MLIFHRVPPPLTMNTLPSPGAPAALIDVPLKTRRVVVVVVECAAWIFCSKAPLEHRIGHFAGANCFTLERLARWLARSAPSRTRPAHRQRAGREQTVRLIACHLRHNNKLSRDNRLRCARVESIRRGKSHQLMRSGGG